MEPFITPEVYQIGVDDISKWLSSIASEAASYYLDSVVPEMEEACDVTPEDFE